jgi:hypothetical protein
MLHLSLKVVTLVYRDVVWSGPCNSTLASKVLLYLSTSCKNYHLVLQLIRNALAVFDSAFPTFLDFDVRHLCRLLPVPTSTPCTAACLHSAAARAAYV